MASAEIFRPTRAGRSLALVMMDPASITLTVAELTKKALISERMYYKLMADSQFRAWINEERRQVVFRYVDPALQAAAKTATIEGREGHQDRKMLLEMAGLYQAKQAHEHSGPAGAPIPVDVRTDLSKLSTEELKQLDALLEKTSEPAGDPPGVGET